MKAEVTISSKFTAQDWERFPKLMEQSDIQDKQLFACLSMRTTRKEIKNLSAAYKVIADEVLPQLWSKMTLLIDVIGRSGEEIASFLKSRNFL